MTTSRVATVDTTSTRATARTLGLLAAFVVAVSTILAGGVAVAPGAHAANTSAESGFVTKINGARSSAGRARLSVASDLTSVARSWASSMASSNRLRHNPNLGSQVRHWYAVGENVGVGSSVASLHTAFMNSPGHKANVLDRDYTQVGIGVASANGRLWVVEVFRKPSGSSAAAPVRAATPRPPAVIGVGSRGAVVKKIQRKVGVRADGTYGQKTKKAVARWQRTHGLRATGTVDAATRRKMHV